MSLALPLQITSPRKHVSGLSPWRHRTNPIDLATFIFSHNGLQNVYNYAFQENLIFRHSGTLKKKSHTGETQRHLVPVLCSTNQSDCTRLFAKPIKTLACVRLWFRFCSPWRTTAVFSVILLFLQTVQLWRSTGFRWISSSHASCSWTRRTPVEPAWHGPTGCLHTLPHSQVWHRGKWTHWVLVVVVVKLKEANTFTAIFLFSN